MFFQKKMTIVQLQRVKERKEQKIIQKIYQNEEKRNKTSVICIENLQYLLQQKPKFFIVEKYLVKLLLLNNYTFLYFYKFFIVIYY